jgi:glutamate dehydrogenase/leucine dehydrogenase
MGIHYTGKLMKLNLSKFENTPPEIVFEWKDAETTAEGWVVINSLRGGAAGGPTRMRKKLNKNEVETMAKTMEVRFTVSGPSIGGACSGINFDPADPRKKAVLERWYRAVTPLLKYYYGTGGDINVSEVEEIIPITAGLGVQDPQEGVFAGHYNSTEEEKRVRIQQLRRGMAKVLTDERYSPSLEKGYTIEDMSTGFSVAQSVKAYYDKWGGDIQKKRAVIQGWGSVGAAAGFFLSQMGVKIVGIVSHEGGVINKDGFSFEEVRALVANKEGNKLVAKNHLPFYMANQKIWDLEFEIFVPAAASRLIIKDQIDLMIASRIEVFPCAAHVPFFDPEIFLGPIGIYADEKFSVIPDFIANCGRARASTYFMEHSIPDTDEAVFDDIAATVNKALSKTYALNPYRTGIAQASFELALKQLVDQPGTVTVV